MNWLIDFVQHSITYSFGYILTMVGTRCSVYNLRPPFAGSYLTSGLEPAVFFTEKVLRYLLQKFSFALRAEIGFLFTFNQVPPLETVLLCNLGLGGKCKNYADVYTMSCGI